MRLSFASVALLGLLVSVAVSSSGCCFLDNTCSGTTAELGGDAGTPAPPFESLDTPGCDASTIREADGVVCAECAFADDVPGDGASAPEDGAPPDPTDDGLASICGRADVAPCEVRENSGGDACQLCVTDGGDILYDDCFSGGGADRDVAFCEEAPGTTSDEVCTSCYDGDGDSVSTRCGPRSDDCTVVDAGGGRTCTECSADGVVVSRTCDAVDLDPSVCRAYENDAGRCVDCLDDDGALLSHACTPATGPSAIACEETVSPEGVSCTVCVDENGTPFDRFCDDGPATARCEQLAFTDQTCVVCLDDDDAVVSIDCVRNDCSVANDAACRADADCATGQACFDGVCVDQNTGGDPGNDGEGAAPAPPACEAPPACVMSVADGGAVCRTCPLATPNDAGAAFETLCIAPPALSCSVVAEDALPPRDGSEGDLAAPQGRSCVVCADRASGVEVYRDCEGNGAVPPPYCIDEPRSTDGAESCSVCYDAVDNQPVYTSCADETCFDLEQQTLRDTSGIPLQVLAEGGGSDDAVVSCKQCAPPDAAADDVDAEAARAAFSTSCALLNVCADPYGSSFAGPACPTTTTLTLLPRACQNPWDAWLPATDEPAGAGVDDVTLLHAILSFTLADHGVALAGARVVDSSTTGECPTLGGAASCDCSSGARVELAVVDDGADVDVVRAAFAGLLAP